MQDSQTASNKKRRHSDRMKPLKMLAVALIIAAVIKELRLPKEQRTWHGALAGFIPYDLRMPSIKKFKDTMWNPDGSIIVNRVFGVGWTINFGALVHKIRSLAGSR